MKKSNYIVVIVAALAAVAGALAAVAIYLKRREKELEDYEQLLFSEEFEDDAPQTLDDLEGSVSVEELLVDEEAPAPEV